MVFQGWSDMKGLDLQTLDVRTDGIPSAVLLVVGLAVLGLVSGNMGEAGYQRLQRVSLWTP